MTGFGRTFLKIFPCRSGDGRMPKNKKTYHPYRDDRFAVPPLFGIEDPISADTIRSGMTCGRYHLSVTWETRHRILGLRKTFPLAPDRIHSHRIVRTGLTPSASSLNVVFRSYLLSVHSDLMFLINTYDTRERKKSQATEFNCTKIYEKRGFPFKQRGIVL